MLKLSLAPLPRQKQDSYRTVRGVIRDRSLLPKTVLFVNMAETKQTLQAHSATAQSVTPTPESHADTTKRGGINSNRNKSSSETSK